MRTKAHDPYSAPLPEKFVDPHRFERADFGQCETPRRDDAAAFLKAIEPKTPEERAKLAAHKAHNYALDDLARRIGTEAAATEEPTDA